MNAGRMRVYADKYALAWKFRATAFRTCADNAKGWRCDPIYIKSCLQSMRLSSLEMRKALAESANRRTAA